MGTARAILSISAILTLAPTTASYCPIRSKPASEGVTAFEAKWYGKSLERMSEPRLPDSAKDLSAEIYRLTILPTWSNPISVRVEKHGTIYSLYARRLDGLGGYDPGELVEAKNVQLDASDSVALDALIENLDFFQLPSDERKRSIGLDGDEWVLEGVSHGRYHVVERWCASSYNVKKRGLKPFLALCRFLIDKSTLSQRPRNKDQKLI